MAFAIVIKTKGLTELPGKLQRFRLGIIARMDIMLRQIGQEVARRSKEDYLSGPRPDKLGRRSGDLARSVNYKVTGNRVVIGSNLKYARIHEKGGTIRARNSPYLVFRIGNQWISTKEVTIPERAFLSPALRDSREDSLRIIRRIAGQALKEALA